MTSQISGADGRGTVLVTGASGGIGRRLVERLADAGFAVYAGARSESGLKAASSISAARVVPIALDITDGESIAAAAQRLAQDLGGRGLAGLINMAGIIVEGPLELIPVANFRRQFEVNVVGPFALTRALLPLLQAGRGHIVNIGAAAAHTTVPFFGAISASKAALASVSDAMRMEFGRSGSRSSWSSPARSGPTSWRPPRHCRARDSGRNRRRGWPSTGRRSRRCGRRCGNQAPTGRRWWSRR